MLYSSKKGIIREMKKLTNSEILSVLTEAEYETAKYIDKLSDLKGRMEYISNITMDNADPEIQAAEVLEKLAVLLSTLVIYKKEYTDEPWKEENENN
jgi:hypothetical protein